MNGMNLVASKLDPAKAFHSHEIPAGDPWIHVVK